MKGKKTLGVYENENENVNQTEVIHITDDVGSQELYLVNATLQYFTIRLTLFYRRQNTKTQKYDQKFEAHGLSPNQHKTHNDHHKSVKCRKKVESN